MRLILFPAAILLLMALVPLTSGADGDWPMWRHDPALTGYQPTPGAMAKEPRIVAKHFLGASPGTATFADLLGSGRDAEVLVLGGHPPSVRPILPGHGPSPLDFSFAAETGNDSGPKRGPVIQMMHLPAIRPAP